MANIRKCEFFVIRYVPDLVKGEFVNIGVVLRDSAGTFSDVKVTRDWRRARCLDGDADVGMLQALEGELREVLQSGAELDQIFLLQKLPDWASNALQLTPTQGVLTDSPQVELGRLAEIYCETKRVWQRTISGRQVIVNAMRDSFEQAGIWGHMWRNMAVAAYTNNGDPLKLDCGYKSNGIVHLFHAVSVTNDLNPAKGLALSYPRIVDGIKRLENARTTLTAIVEDGLDHHDDGIRYGLRVLTESSIFVEPMAMLPSIAQQARRDLGV